MATLTYWIFIVVCFLTIIDGGHTRKQTDTSSLDVPRFRLEVLNQHNVLRQNQWCSGILTANTTLDGIAQTHADKLASNGEIAHSGTTFYGENIWHITKIDPSTLTGSMPVNAWFAESVNYTSTNYNKTLHFTQIVWKATKLLGVGLSFTANGGAITVCNYYPRGNYLGQFVQNVDCS